MLNSPGRDFKLIPAVPPALHNIIFSQTILCHSWTAAEACTASPFWTCILLPCLLTRGPRVFLRLKSGRIPASLGLIPESRSYLRHRVPQIFAPPRMGSGRFKISEGQLRSVPAFSSSARVLSRRHGSLSASKKRVSFTAFLLFFLLFSYNSHTISEFFDSVKCF